ncbi:MAG: hypothetical protein CM1200mP40_12760 [Gammaproteobacteria bacterium]|nr:MAG: hypothetical protein CM1200mP40_12760 [Gammaproteobacteria bacterium]
MALNAAEEETIEALKKWWDENGRQLVLIVVAVLTGYTSWILWQNNQSATAESASDMYEEILALAATEPGVVVTEEERAEIIELSNQLITDHPDRFMRNMAHCLLHSSMCLTTIWTKRKIHCNG